MESNEFSVQDARRLTSVYRAASDTTVSKIVAMAVNKIRLAATMGQGYTVWRVPCMIQDAPLFDRLHMRSTVASLLRRQGYHVVELDNHMLFMTWSV